jgi:hypothetical protein
MAEFLWISWLLDSDIKPNRQKQLHRKDIWATWFGVPYYQSEPCLYTYPRLQNLLRNSSSSDSLPDVQYPSLVSFFGDTGGGKSTLIMALIRNACSASAADIETPVPGNWADIHKSTSGDVHMYADPTTRASAAPLFYAGMHLVTQPPLWNRTLTKVLDCEGLRGSGRSVASHLSTSQAARKTQFETHSVRYALEVKNHQNTSCHQLKLAWGKITIPSNPYAMDLKHVSSNTHRLAVKELYPRLLYTFSDVVCYVTANVK